MTKLGHGDLVTRLKGVAHGLLHPPHTHGKGEGVIVIGHRGAASEAPENTRRSFALAIERGADAIEVDVCRTRDGRFVLFHDPDPRETITLARDLGEGLAYVANEPAIGSPYRKPISELTYEEFVTHYGYTERSDAVSHVLDGNTRPEIAPEPLEALLDFASSEPRLTDVYVDMKLRADQLADARELARVLETSNERARTPTRFHLMTAEEEVLEALRECSLELQLYGDFELPGVLDLAPKLQLKCVAMGMGQRLWPSFHREVVDVVAARDRGELESVIVWTINDEERLRALVAANVNGIVTDRPGDLRKILTTQG